MKSDQSQFLRDLGRLLHRYGPEPFAQLASILADESKRSQVIEGLSSLAEAAARAKSRRRSTGVQRVSSQQAASEIIENVRANDPSKAMILEHFYKRAATTKSQRLQGELSDLRKRLAVEGDLQQRRAGVIVGMLHRLSELPLDQVERELTPFAETKRELADSTQKPAGELGQWAEIIGRSGRRRQSLNAVTKTDQ